jgi:hypothetical protein
MFLAFTSLFSHLSQNIFSHLSDARAPFSFAPPLPCRPRPPHAAGRARRPDRAGRARRSGRAGRLSAARSRRPPVSQPRPPSRPRVLAARRSPNRVRPRGARSGSARPRQLPPRDRLSHPRQRPSTRSPPRQRLPQVVPEVRAHGGPAPRRPRSSAPAAQPPTPPWTFPTQIIDPHPLQPSGTVFIRFLFFLFNVLTSESLLK